MKHTYFLVFALTLFGGHSTTFAQSFEEALASAYQHSPRLKAQQAQVRIVNENLIAAKAAGKLNASLEGLLGGGYVDRTSASVLGSASSSDDGTSRSAGLTLLQPLYQGGRVSSLKKQASSQILSARAELRDVEQNVLLNAATAYIDVLRDEKIAAAQRNSVAVLSRQLIAVKTKFKLGEGTKTDVSQSETRLEESKIGLARAGANLNSSKAAFVREMGYQPEELSTPKEISLPAKTSNLTQSARNYSPRLEASRHLEEAAQSSIGVAKSALKPTLGLNGQLISGEDDFSNFSRATSAQITAQLRIPLLTGGLRQSRVRAAKEVRQQRRFETRDLEYSVDQTVANLRGQLEASKDILISSRKQVGFAQSAFEGVKTEFGVGTRTALDVLNAEQELLDAEISVARSEHDTLLYTYQLLTTIGKFDARSLQLPVVQYDPGLDAPKLASVASPTENN
ncbi:MAG: hypothetical protein EX271_05210 [Acidimicrobiales bacterium]|nr:MAG: hypothetical protein EX271_05210 [Acidimicrobiales bacterium]